MRMDSTVLASGLRSQGVEAMHLASVEEIVATVSANCMESDVVAILSNGAFGGIHERLLNALKERFESP
jgi:UDP-N-acetylmuramate: L-alanyl-gamma-D-glutamyl-meso-diaminopimelate ligase